MPIALKEFSWHQNAETVLLKVQTSARMRPSAKNCNVTLTSRYVKVNLPPFIFESFLAAGIVADGAASKVTFGSDHVTLSLPKAEVGVEWATLEEADLDKDQKQQRRRQAEDELRDALQNREKAAKDKNEKLEKGNVQKQLEQMEEGRRRIERIKQQVIKQAFEDTLHWKQTLPQQENKVKIMDKQICELKPENEDKEDENEGVEEEPPSEPVELLVDFTPRILPTPKRESNKDWELKWQKQKEEALKLAGFEAETIENADPGWMVEKARELVLSGKHAAASAVASHALASCPSHGDLRVALAVASLHLGHWFAAIECCTRGLEAAASLEATTKANLVAVRGVALVRSGRREEGLQEIAAAGLTSGQIDPLLQTLTADLNIEAQI